jgi:hypothetical protein
VDVGPMRCNAIAKLVERSDFKRARRPAQVGRFDARMAHGFACDCAAGFDRVRRSALGKTG